MTPNSAHQLWSKWTFRVLELGRRAPRPDVEANAARWLREGFGSAGKVRVVRTPLGWRIECVVEGPQANDATYVARVREQFRARFVRGGWGLGALGDVRARVIAGDAGGKSPAQWVEMPTLIERAD